MTHLSDRTSTLSLVVAALLVISTAACGDDDGGAPDAGSDAGIDASAPFDAGDPLDAGGDDDAGAEDAGADDAGDPGDDAGIDASTPDASMPDAGPRTLVAVSHPRELRAMWVATVSRLDFPSNTGLSETQARAELTAIADLARATGLNALFFQVRPESDALYASTLEPWSRFLSGTQGVSPGWDPLAMLIEIARPRGLEVHAWLNPYRALTSTSIVAAANHVTRRFPEAAITYNNAVVMNPADTRVRAHVVAVVNEIVEGYDVDGVVFDDYFYPYPDASGTPFPDDASYNAYVAGGGTMTRLDWRRDNVNQLIAAVSSAIKAREAWVTWGVSPFGIYRPGMPPGITGLDAYNLIAADSVRWISEGWVDYLSPQLYWSTSSTGQNFNALIAWWADRAPPGRFVHPSLGLYRPVNAEWTATEFETQVALTRAEAPQTAGHVWFRHRMLVDNARGEQAMFGRLYPRPARPPAVIETAADVVAPPFVVRSGASTVSLSHPSMSTIRGYAVYRDVGGTLGMFRWVPSGTTTTSLAAGRYAVSAIARGGAESLGVEVVIP